MANISYHSREIPNIRIEPLGSLGREVFTVTFNSVGDATTHFFDSESQIIDFKNKVLWAYEEYLRDKRSSG